MCQVIQLNRQKEVGLPVLGWGLRGCGDSTMAKDTPGGGSIALSQGVEGGGVREEEDGG